MVRNVFFAFSNLSSKLAHTPPPKVDNISSECFGFLYWVHRFPLDVFSELYLVSLLVRQLPYFCRYESPSKCSACLKSSMSCQHFKTGIISLKFVPYSELRWAYHFHLY